VTEARRRFAPLRKELEANKKSVDFLDVGSAKLKGLSRTVPFQLLDPQLLEGAWRPCFQ